MSNGYVSLEREGYDALFLLGEDLRNLVDLALRYGWDDAEGRLELRFFGDGSNDDPGVLSDEGAALLAEALEGALDDIPNHDARAHKLRASSPQAAARGWLEEDPARPVSLLERFSGDEKGVVRAMAALCRRGGFQVVWQRW